MKEPKIEERLLSDESRKAVQIQRRRASEASGEPVNAYLKLAASEHGGSTDGALLEPDESSESSEPSDPAW